MLQTPIPLGENYAFVVNQNREPQAMVRADRAQWLLKTGQAAKLRHEPLVLILKKDVRLPGRTYRLKVDPGSKYTGFAIVDDRNTVVYAMELHHRGEAIRMKLIKRAMLRRNRRGRKCRYREARFDNRTRPAGWLPPSIRHRVDTTMTWINRFIRYAPITALSVEHVKFDFKDLKPKSKASYAVREKSIKAYLLERYHGQCVYCSSREGLKVMEHVIPRSKGGSDHLSNLVLACSKCNQAKDNDTLEVFLAKKPDVLERVHKLMDAPVKLKDAAAVNSSRKELVKRAEATGLPVELGTGVQTALNRERHKAAKTHWVDAACVGDTGREVLICKSMKPLYVKCMGHGNRQMTAVDKYGFPNSESKTTKSLESPVGLIRTGDIVHLEVTKGKHAGRYSEERIKAVKIKNNQVTIVVKNPKTAKTEPADLNPKAVTRLLQRNDGYRYSHTLAA